MTLDDADETSMTVGVIMLTMHGGAAREVDDRDESDEVRGTGTIAHHHNHSHTHAWLDEERTSRWSGTHG